ncbi:MAG: GNAT family N-acetyltransferase [Gemmatimonadales bacterium]|nr:MAG: GNAT family N-acetyltransferase [Gemmatimonadales bacterium]
MSSGPSVAPAFPEDFPAVLPLLRRLDPRREPEAWRPVFDYGWRRPDEPVGYILRDGGKVLGFIGTILSEMDVNGRPERFCNIGSWIVLDEARGAGALLVMQLQRLGDTTITSLTSNVQSARVLLRLGFREFDTAWTVLRPTRRMFVPGSGVGNAVLGDPERIRPHLGEADRRILDDHLPYAHHLLATGSTGQCFAVYTLRTRWRLPTARFHYLSDHVQFPELWPGIQRHLMHRHGSVLGEAESRLLAGIRVPGSMTKAMAGPRLFKSRRLRPEEVRELYSEVILLGLG